MKYDQIGTPITLSLNGYLYLKEKIHKIKMLKSLKVWNHMGIRVKSFLPDQVSDRVGRSSKSFSLSGRELGRITLPDNVPDRVLMSGKRFSSFLPLFLVGLELSLTRQGTRSGVSTFSPLLAFSLGEP